MKIYDEIVVHDVYRLKTLHFTPKVIFDIGANEGVFAKQARALFPDARIISVEPNDESTVKFIYENNFIHDHNITLLHKAIGNTVLFHGLEARSSGQETYLSSGLGYPLELMELEPTLEKSNIELIMPDELINTYWKGEKSIFKCDCEGCENAFMQHEPSIQAILKMDYITFEIHWYSLHGGLQGEVKKATLGFMKRFSDTHDCSMEGNYFYATKK